MTREVHGECARCGLEDSEFGLGPATLFLCETCFPAVLIKYDGRVADLTAVLAGWDDPLWMIPCQCCGKEVNAPHVKPVHTSTCELCDVNLINVECGYGPLDGYPPYTREEYLEVRAQWPDA